MKQAAGPLWAVGFPRGDVGGDALGLVAREELKPQRPVLPPLHRRPDRDWYNRR
jgi:hypothetical protein